MHTPYYWYMLILWNIITIMAPHFGVICGETIKLYRTNVFLLTYPIRTFPTDPQWAKVRCTPQMADKPGGIAGTVLPSLQGPDIWKALVLLCSTCSGGWWGRIPENSYDWTSRKRNAFHGLWYWLVVCGHPDWKGWGDSHVSSFARNCKSVVFNVAGSRSQKPIPTT